MKELKSVNQLLRATYALDRPADLRTPTHRDLFCFALSQKKKSFCDAAKYSLSNNCSVSVKIFVGEA